MEISAYKLAKDINGSFQKSMKGINTMQNYSTILSVLQP